MDKFLRLDFFKQFKFLTKQDGIEFIDSLPELKNAMVTCHADIEDFKALKISEFETEFEKYSTQRNTFLLNLKERRKYKQNIKKEQEKKALKDDIRAELLKELEMEKNMEIINMNKDLFPIYVKNDGILDIDELFKPLIINKNKLSIEDLDCIKILKERTEKAMKILNMVHLELTKFNLKIE